MTRTKYVTHSPHEQRTIEHLKRHIAQRGVTRARVDAVVRRLATAAMIQELNRDACDWESPEYWEHHNNATAINDRIAALGPDDSIPLIVRLREVVRC